MTESEIKQLEKARRQSLQVIPVSAGISVISATGLWASWRFLDFSVVTFLAAIAFAMTVFGLLGDVVNVLYCNRKLKAVLNDE